MSSKELLKKIPFFSSLSDEILSKIESISRTVSYKKGEHIFLEGSFTSDLYMVASGEVKIVRENNGSEITIATFKEKEFFGEVALFTDSPRTAGAYASKDSTLVRIKGENLIDLIYEIPEIAIEIIKIQGDRLRKSTKQIESLTIKLFELAKKIT